MTTPVVSVYSYELIEPDGGTLLKLSHHVVGEPAPKWEAEHRRGWGHLLGRCLKAYVEEGKKY